MVDAVAAAGNAQAAGNGTQATDGPSDQQAEQFFDLILMNMAFDEFGEAERMRARHREQQQEDETAN